MTALDTWLRARPDRCSGCGHHVPTQGHGGECAPVAPGLALKAHGQAVASNAHPADRAKVEAAVRQLAATGRPFSANDARAIHGVKGGVVGAVFTALKNEGVIRACGDEVSTDAGTHGHRLYLWVGTASEAAA